jgi:hypothetical protein
MSDYREVQEWARKRKRQVLAHVNGHRPGSVLGFSDGKRYVVARNGARIFVGAAPEVEAAPEVKEKFRAS